MLVDEDDATRYLIGECFLHIDNEDADERISHGVQELWCDVNKQFRNISLSEQLLQKWRRCRLRWLTSKQSTMN